MLIDEVSITIKGGNGGRGMVHFYADHWRPKGGPDGGNGGDGGSVYFRAVSDISKLHQFRHQKYFSAKDGYPGGKNQRTGHNGDDLFLDIPVGSVVTYDNGSQIELSKVGETVLIAKGGRGGYGNYHYRSSTNQTPKEFQSGQITNPKNIFINLKLIADIGLIGLPNAGKTSILNELTTASAKVANYPFTTLEPNLGVTKGNKIIADIPGLIEGASQGKGLGYKFLKHIERTRLLVHCVASDSINPLKDYQTIRQELKNYSAKLFQKPEVIILTKTDLIDKATLAKMCKILTSAIPVSIIDPVSLKNLADLLTITLAKSESEN